MRSKTLLIHGQKQKVNYSSNHKPKEIIEEPESSDGKKVVVHVETTIEGYPTFSWKWESYYVENKRRTGVITSLRESFIINGDVFKSEKKIFEHFIMTQESK